MKHYCYLCKDELTDKNHCDAHIISKFIWREYMERGGARTPSIVLKGNNQPPRYLKTLGITDPDILCRKCDDEILGKIENDFKEVWERVFANGKLYDIKKGSTLIGWGKVYIKPEDIIKTKLFLLCCIWRASISKLEDYKLKLNFRQEEAIKRVLLGEKRSRLPYIYSTICSKFNDEDSYCLNVAPYLIEANGVRLVRLHLPRGYVFAIKIGIESIKDYPDELTFGGLKEAFFIRNSGKMQGSIAERRLFSETVSSLRNMYPSDKKRLRSELLTMGSDISDPSLSSLLEE